MKKYRVYMGQYDSIYDPKNVQLLATLAVKANNKGLAIQKAVERAVRDSGGSIVKEDIEYIKAIEVI